MIGDFIRFLSSVHLRSRAWPVEQRSGAPATAPTLPLLQHEESLEPAAWLEESMTSFAKSVASFLPGHFAAYARVYHPFDMGGLVHEPAESWGELALRYGYELRDAASAEQFAYHGVPNAQARHGRLPLAVIDVLLEHLHPGTTTPNLCYFAVWNGFGGSVVPHTLEPLLELPGREYHVFSGPLTAARTSYQSIELLHQPANLWWPADHAWCVASEIDHSWSYVGGSSACIEAILADPRLDAVATSAAERW